MPDFSEGCYCHFELGAFSLFLKRCYCHFEFGGVRSSFIATAIHNTNPIYISTGEHCGRLTERDHAGVISIRWKGVFRGLIDRVWCCVVWCSVMYCIVWLHG